MCLSSECELGLSLLWRGSYRKRAASTCLPFPPYPPTPRIREQQPFGKSGYRPTCSLERSVTNSIAVDVGEGICLKSPQIETEGRARGRLSTIFLKTSPALHLLSDFPAFDKDSGVEKYFPIRKTPGQGALCHLHRARPVSWTGHVCFLCSGGCTS